MQRSVPVLTVRLSLIVSMDHSPVSPCPLGLSANFDDVRIQFRR